MARQRRGEVEQGPTDLNLAPMMNLVIILIPMLLLSVVFLEVGVINITAPTLSVGGPPSDDTPKEDDKPPLNLTVGISSNGFQIAATGGVLGPMSGCPDPGPTVCLENQSVNVSEKFEQARQAFRAGNAELGEELLEDGVQAFNYRELYNFLARIKEEYPDETIINLSADSDIPYAALVRVMDVSRFRLEKDSYSASSEFWGAEYRTEGQAYAELFSSPVLQILQ